MSQTLLHIEGLTCRFGRKTVLDGIGLDLAAGESLLIAGPNGAGKSTFLRCLTGVLLPDHGRVHFAPELTRREVGYISDRQSLYADARLEEAITFHLAEYSCRDYDDRLTSALKLDRRRRIAELSAGERVIFHLSLVLSQKPRLLLVDEVIHQMDSYTRDLLLESLIEALEGGRTTLVMVNHTFTEVERIPERVLIMDGGRFIVDEKNEELKARTKKVISATPLPVELPVLFRKSAGLYSEYYLHPFREEFRSRYPLDFIDLNLAETIKAFIGGHYAPERMA